MASNGLKSLLRSKQTLLTLGVLVIIIHVLMAVATAGAGQDIWWHLRLGQDIVKTGELNASDHYSYTFAGSEQRNQEWLADLLLYTAYNSGNFFGLYLLKCLVVSLMAIFLFLYLRNLLRDEPSRSEERISQSRSLLALFTSIAVVLAITMALRFRLQFPRPYLFSFMMTAIFLYLLGRTRQSGNGHLLYWLPFVQLLWSNLSSGALFGPFIFGGYALTLLRCGRLPFKRLLLPGAGILLSLFINPDGVGTVSNLYQNLTSKTQVELARFVVEQYTLIETIENGVFVSLVIPGLVLVALALVQIVAGGGFRQIHQLAFLLFFSLLGFYQVRLLSFAIIFAAEPLARLLFSLLTRVAGSLREYHTRMAAALLCLLPLYPLAIPLFKIYPLQFNFNQGLYGYPDQAIEFIRRSNLKGAMLNNYTYGSYLIWKLPEHKVFIDTRGPILYREQFFREYMEAYRSREAWERLEKRWNLSFAIFQINVDPTNLRLPQEYPLHLEENENWALVYWDSRAVIYVRKNSVTPSFLAQHEYRFVKPSRRHYKELTALSRDVRAKKFTRFNKALQLLEHEIRINPNNQEPKISKARLLLAQNDPETIIEANQLLREAIAQPPSQSIEYLKYAESLLLLGQHHEARQVLTQLITMEPGNKLAHQLLQRLK